MKTKRPIKAISMIIDWQKKTMTLEGNVFKYKTTSMLVDMAIEAILLVDMMRKRK